MTHLTEWLAMAGTVLVAIAYVPQILHLAVAHCSAGVSVRAWVLWLAADLLILTHSIHLRDVPFLVLGVGNIVATCVVIVLSLRYRGNLCVEHSHALAKKGRRGEVHDHPH
jgi:hypothetical protein